MDPPPQQQLAWGRVRQQALRYGLPELDALHHRDFEYAVRDLMLRDGCADARQVGGAGDNGADVLATDPLGRTWVIQCKHRKDGDRGSAVGTPDLQRVNGTARQLYGADIVLVVTNGRFSARCPPLAAQLHMHLADRRTLAAWAVYHAPVGAPAEDPRSPERPSLTPTWAPDFDAALGHAGPGGGRALHGWAPHHRGAVRAAVGDVGPHRRKGIPSPPDGRQQILGPSGRCR